MPLHIYTFVKQTIVGRWSPCPVLQHPPLLIFHQLKQVISGRTGRGDPRPTMISLACLTILSLACMSPSLVGQWSPCHVLQHPHVSRPPSPSAPVLSSSFIRPLLLTNIKNQWLRVINVWKVWRTAVFFLFLCGNVKCICEIMHNTQRKNSHNILTY